jgi:hypothetical protein
MQLVGGVSGLIAVQIRNIFTQKYPFGDGLALLEMGILRKWRMGDINDIGDDWWAPAHSSWGIVFRKTCDNLTYKAYEKRTTCGMQNIHTCSSDSVQHLRIFRTSEERWEVIPRPPNPAQLVQ